MAKQIIRLMESELVKMVKNVISEQSATDAVNPPLTGRISIDETLLSQRGRFAKLCGRHLNEASIKRILSHGKDGFVIVSANRSDVFSANKETSLANEYSAFLSRYGVNKEQIPPEKWLERRNADADKSLQDEIRSEGYAYSPVYGGYHGSDDVSDSYEPSYIVYNHFKNGEVGDWGKLFRLALDWCGKFKQDSVYIQSPDDAPKYYDMHGQEVSACSSKKFIVDDPSQIYFTTNKRKKNNPHRFTADISFEEEAPSELNEALFGHMKTIPALSYDYVPRMRESQRGVVFLMYDSNGK